MSSDCSQGPDVIFVTVSLDTDGSAVVSGVFDGGIFELEDGEIGVETTMIVSVFV